jgi:hypothetical protein
MICHESSITEDNNMASVRSDGGLPLYNRTKE